MGIDLAPLLHQITREDSDAHDEAKDKAACTMGVGCETVGVCYADAMGRPDLCGKRYHPSHGAGSE
jgi:hypothetical protein